ncbi:putative cell division cycle protein [Triangularia verruculosa]|uniref:Cell division cycle protein n=1 Tax=Triangularia verruculosa TaxID=2587418 RepID=A0AAN6XPS8_9PEZI|nr:putative cell division cycle protein [Triangularia verruculosa]
MPAIEGKPAQPVANKDGEFVFPPVKREHILHCSYDYWFPKYRTSCVRSEIIPLTPDFVSYIHEDGIILAHEGSSDPNQEEDDDDWEPTNPSSDFPPPPREPDDESDSDDEEETTPNRLPPNQRFPDLHNKIESTIKQLGGAVAPKLNWSSPRDATWISRHPNTVKCTSANDIYILLKSSSFISHDLNHAFDDTVPVPNSPPFQPVLVLRSYFNIHPSLEFRCFVKDRNLVALTQRDPNYYPFLRSLRPHIISRTKELFTKRLKFTFPEGDFVFDVYIPEASYDDEVNRLGRARLIDINPWAPRTDPIMFGWDELLEINVKRPVIGGPLEDNGSEGDSESDEEEEGEEEDQPELRLVEKDDPAAYNFSSPAFSAHKLPKEVVDASQAGEGGMREFAESWRNFTQQRERQQQQRGQQAEQGRVEEVPEESEQPGGGGSGST